MELCMEACRSGDLLYITSKLTKSFKNDNLEWTTLLDAAYELGQMNIVHTIQDSKRVDLGRMMKSACYFGDIDFVSCHLDCDVDWRSLLCSACVRGHSSLASLLQEKVGSADMARLACITTMPRPTCRLNYGELTDSLVDLFEAGRISIKKMFKVCEDLTLSRKRIIRKLKLISDKRFDILLHNELKVVYPEFVLEVIFDFIQLCRIGDIDKDTYMFITRNSVLHPRFKLLIAIYMDDTDFVYEAVRGVGDFVDWGYLMQEAYECGHVKLARYIHDRRSVKVDWKIVRHACVARDVVIMANYIWHEFTIDNDIPIKFFNLCLIEASIAGHVDIISLIAENRQLTMFDNEMLLACVKGNVDYVQEHVHNTSYLLKYPCYLSYLNAAFLTQHLAIVDIILRATQQEGVSIKEIMETTVNLIDVIEGTFPVHCNRSILQYLSEKMVIDIPEADLTPLHRSCYSGHYASSFKLFMRLSLPNVKQTKKQRWTPLHVLCLGQNEEMDAIIQRGSLGNMFTMQEQDKNKLLKQKGAFHKDMNYKVEILHLLMYHGADVDPVDDNLQTPLHLACISGAYELVLCLLNYGANIDHVDWLGMTPVACAAWNNHASIIELLVKRKCNLHLRNIYGQNPLHHSCMMGHIECVNILISCKDLLDERDDEQLTPISLATRAENVDILKVLLAHNADPTILDNEQQLPLHKAAVLGNYQCVKLLLPRTSNINHQDISGSTPLHLATKYQHSELIDVLLKYGADANVSDHIGNIPLHAARHKNITALAKNSVKIDHQNHSGETPLMYAASCLDLISMKELLAKGADKTITDHMGRCLLHAAVISNRHGLVLRECLTVATKVKIVNKKRLKIINVTTALNGDLKFAIPKEAQLNNKDFKGKVVLESFFLSIIEYLLSIDLYIDALDHNESSPLHLAAESGNLTAVQVLLQNKARPQTRDKFGHMPVMLALKYPNVFTLLWRVSQKYMGEEDLKRLCHLAHWADTRSLIIANKIPVPPVELTRAQNARTLSFKIDPDRLSAWLRQTSEELPQFMSGWLPSLQPLTFVQHPYVIKVMDMFMADLEVSVRKIDPLVAFSIRRCGSEDEKTKVILKDEEDCSCVQENIRFDMFETPTYAGHPVWKAFVKLVSKPEYYKHLERVLDEKKRLSQSKLCQHFGSAVAKALADFTLWRKYPQLMRVTVKDITAGSKKISALLVLWSDNVYPLMEISVDLVPVIDLSGWYPSWCNQHPLIKYIDCIALPKWKMTHNIDLDLMEVGVFQWRPWFEMMPEEMRQGFRLAKVMKDKAVCPKIEEWDEVHAGEFISTYYLKQCIMKEYMEIYDQQVQGLKPEIQSDLFYARKIYERLEGAFQNRELWSIFIPEYNLLNDDKFVQYQETAVSYARLCRRLLTPESVAHFKKAYMGMQG